MRVVTFKIDEELLERFDRVVISRGLSRSEVIRELIKAYLESIKGKDIRVKYEGTLK